MIADEKRCDSMKRVVLHREGKEVYLRCQKTVDHVSRNHESWMLAWSDDEEDGWLDS